MTEMHALVKGKVQGVGFRATAKFYAEALKLTGTVRNCADGSVEICAQGPQPELEALLEKLKSTFSDHIQSIEVSYRPAGARDSSFRITH